MCINGKIQCLLLGLLAVFALTLGACETTLSGLGDEMEVDPEVTPDPEPSPDPDPTPDPDPAEDPEPEALEAPTLSSPAVDAKVFASITVTGTASPGATVALRLRQGSATLGSAQAVANASGSFSIELNYVGAQTGVPLSLEATQTLSGETSPAATRALEHDSPYTISGVVSEGGSASQTGETVYVLLLRSDSAESVLDPIETQSLDVTSGSPLAANLSFSFAVPAGDYVLRAFRDAGGPAGVADGDPTLGTDAQSAHLDVSVVAADVADADLVVDGPGSGATYNDFDVFTLNESEFPRAAGDPSGLDGFCEGYYLAFQAEVSGLASELSAPTVRTPSGSVVTLIDDGGCSAGVQDNTAQSYDDVAGDGVFTLGIPEPTDALAGTYVFFASRAADDAVHVARDAVDAIVKLSRERTMLAPFGVLHTGDSYEISWNAVTDATGYELEVLDATSAASYVLAEGDTTTYPVDGDFPDDSCFTLSLTAFVGTVLGEWDAASTPRQDHVFCRDDDDDSTVTVSGNVTNFNSVDAPLVIETSRTGSLTGLTRQTLAAGATSYSIEVLASAVTGDGELLAFLDYAGTGDPESEANVLFVESFTSLDYDVNAMQDLSFEVPVTLSTPTPGSEAASATPAFAWQDYSAVSGAPGAFSYAFFVADSQSSSDLPQTLFVLPSTTTAFDLASPPLAVDAVDVVALASCDEGGGTPSFAVDGTQSCSGAAFTSTMSLSIDTDFGWGVFIVPCDFDDFDPAGASTATYTSCLLSVVADESLIFAQSAESGLRGPSS